MPRQILHLNFNTETTADPLSLARRFAARHHDALLNAAQLLGGPKAHRRYMDMISALRETPALTRRLKTELVELHRLLMLERVGEPDSIESGLFALIDPGDPIVHDLCRLADRLGGLLVEIGDATKGVDVEARSIPAEDAA